MNPLSGFTAFLPNNKEKFDQYAALYHPIEVPARTVLLSEGKISKKAFLIEKGCIRTWFNSNGREITFQFFFEGEGVSSIESFRKNIPSLYAIETVEPCSLHWIYKKDLDLIMRDIGEDRQTSDRFMDIMLERQFNYMRHFMSYIRNSPRERYLHLLKEKPQIIQRVPQHYIASYLGITPVSLSRIRNSVR